MKEFNMIQIDRDSSDRVSSIDLSEHLGTSYKATNNLVNKHKKRLESLGLLPFKKDAKGQKVPAYLNEDQSYFLLTLSKNTEMVIQCKFDLVKAFSKLRKKQAEIDSNHARMEWQQNRELGKLTHRVNTDIIQLFLSYAGAQGSRHYPAHGYSMIARMINKALDINNRDDINEDTLALLSSAEIIAEKALTDGMTGNLKYNEIYQLAKTRVIEFTNLIKQAA